MSEIAIMGGTFNPIHIGHLIIAELVYGTGYYDSIMFIPTKTPPHKKNCEIIDSEHRLKMCQLATCNNPHFYVSTIELDREGTTYTVDTIKALKREFPSNHYYFIIGTDTLMDLVNWKKIEEFSELCHFILVNRIGYNKNSVNQQIEYLMSQYKIQFKFLEIPYIDISSTDIREKISFGKSIKYMVHDKVEDYISKKKLYFDEPVHLPRLIQKFEKKLSKDLSARRYEHSMGVKTLAMQLARIYHGDIENAAIAGILHDCAKNYSDKKKLKLCEKYNIELSDAEKENFDLIHAKLGAAIARDVYKVNKQDVLNAIRYHTTARPNMSLLEKIIYIADYIEPTRDKAPNLDELREMARYSLDKTLLKILEDSVQHLKSKNKVIDSKTKEAYKYYKKQGDK